MSVERLAKAGAVRKEFKEIKEFKDIKDMFRSTLNAKCLLFTDECLLNIAPASLIVPR